MHLGRTIAAPACDDAPGLRGSVGGATPLVLLVEDREEARSEKRQVLELSGFRVIDTDNGQDAAKRARYEPPDLVLVDLDVPLLYELVAARLIVKQALLRAVPVVIVTHDEELDTGPLAEVGISRDEYVTRLSDYGQLERLLDYLLPAGPVCGLKSDEGDGRGEFSFRP